MKEKNNGRWRDAKYLLSLLLVLLVMGLIFFFSAQPLKQSTGASGVCVDGLIRVSVPEYGGMSADSQQRLWQRLSFLVRKAAHLLEYAVSDAPAVYARLAAGGPFRAPGFGPGGSPSSTPRRTSCTSSSSRGAARASATWASTVWGRSWGSFLCC